MAREFWKYLDCIWIRGWHLAERKDFGSGQGGFICIDCGHAGESLDDMGFKGGGFVPPLRRVYNRDSRSITRESWDRV